MDDISEREVTIRTTSEFQFLVLGPIYKLRLYFCQPKITPLLSYGKIMLRSKVDAKACKGMRPFEKRDSSHFLRYWNGIQGADVIPVKLINQYLLSPL
jgi:hypothetical protein